MAWLGTAWEAEDRVSKSGKEGPRPATHLACATSPSVGSILSEAQTGLTFSPRGPFGPWPRSNETA